MNMSFIVQSLITNNGTVATVAYEKENGYETTRHDRHTYHSFLNPLFL